MRSPTKIVSAMEVTFSWLLPILWSGFMLLGVLMQIGEYFSRPYLFWKLLVELFVRVIVWYVLFFFFRTMGRYLRAGYRRKEVEMIGANLPATRQPSWVWWLLPILFTVPGGIIAWLSTRHRNPGRARWFAVAGVLLFLFQVSLGLSCGIGYGLGEQAGFEEGTKVGYDEGYAAASLQKPTGSRFTEQEVLGFFGTEMVKPARFEEFKKAYDSAKKEVEEGKAERIWSATYIGDGLWKIRFGIRLYIFNERTLTLKP